MRIAMISDLHGNLDFEVPEADLLLIAGDLCPASHSPLISVCTQQDWLNYEFKRWLKKQLVKNVVICPGNHDWIFEKDINKVPHIDNVHYLIDNYITLLELKIYGSPWQLPFCNWAFNLKEERLKLCWDNIPEDTDILLCHSPPYGIMDVAGRNSNHIGSKTLLNRIVDIKPKLVVFGHNHQEHGVLEEDGVKYINASLIDEKYKMNKEPIIIEL